MLRAVTSFWRSGYTPTSVPTRDQILEDVRHLASLRSQGRARDQGSEDVPLGPSGLDLDSIAIAELFLDCAGRFGVSPPLQLLAEGQPTLAMLVDAISQALR